MHFVSADFRLYHFGPCSVSIVLHASRSSSTHEQPPYRSPRINSLVSPSVQCSHRVVLHVAATPYRSPCLPPLLPAVATLCVRSSELVLEYTLDKAMTLFLACLKDFAEFAKSKDQENNIPPEKCFKLSYKYHRI
ncbi:hypothetical protein S83_050812 [Arachis hypogaea]